jgi:transmembrane sensor
MKHNTIKHLLERYAAGQCSEEERRLVEQWYALLDDPDVEPQESTEADVHNRMWSAIHQRTGIKAVVVKPLWQRPMVRIAAAAAVTLLVGAIWFLRPATTDPSLAAVTTKIRADHRGFIRQVNTTTTTQVLALSDGSQIQLTPGATLEYPATFVNEPERVVRLQGNAFFKVAHDPQHPFIVRAGNIVTRVLGTSFWIKMQENKRVEVSVRTGRVQVSDLAAQGPGIVLTPNQQAAYEPERETFEAKVVEQPVLLIPETAQDSLMPKMTTNFYFRKTKLSQVLNILQSAYGVEMALENPSIGACDFTGNLTGLSFQSQMNLICKSLKVSYRAEGLKYVISGSGCK